MLSIAPWASNDADSTLDDQTPATGGEVTNGRQKRMVPSIEPHDVR